MAFPVTEAVRTRRARIPKIVIDASQLAHIEALAEGAIQRDPAMADRLLTEIERARIVAPQKMPKNVVSIGSTVTYRDELSGQEKSIVLVFPEEADIAQQKVSLMTPIGVALLGLSEGATFHWDTRDNKRRRLTVIGVAPSSAATDVTN